jgi:photosystem II stability/assembly factor-like uncharacterized protein
VASPGFARDRTIFAGTSKPAPDGTSSDLVLWRSTDGGQRWRRWLVTRGPNVLPLAISPGFPIDETVFVGVGGRVMKPLRDAQEIRAGERRPIWRGVELTRQSVSVTALAASPNYRDDATVFAATGAGVYVSRDAGASFTRWSEGLASAAVVALAISPDYGRDRLIYALGLGGTIWRRRDRF